MPKNLHLHFLHLATESLTPILYIFTLREESIKGISIKSEKAKLSFFSRKKNGEGFINNLSINFDMSYSRRSFE